MFGFSNVAGFCVFSDKAGKSVIMKFSSIRDDLFFAFLAFLMWGFWALYANWINGWQVAVVSGLVQGCFSFFMTLMMGILVQYFYRYFEQPVLKLVMPALLILILACVLLLSVHLWFGTPELILTITPALLVGFLFCVFKTLQLRIRGVTNA